MNIFSWEKVGTDSFFSGTLHGIKKIGVFRIGILLISAILLCHTMAQAELIETYTARLSETDHYNSKGERLTSAAAIIRQDRANFHKFDAADPEDTGDSYFAGAGNRATLERLLERGTTTKGAYKAIVNGTPLIEVKVYQNGSRTYVDVEVVESSGQMTKPLKKGTGSIHE